jgi:hypothetical protein
MTLSPRNKHHAMTALANLAKMLRALYKLKKKLKKLDLDGFGESMPRMR